MLIYAAISLVCYELVISIRFFKLVTSLGSWSISKLCMPNLLPPSELKYLKHLMHCKTKLCRSILPVNPLPFATINMFYLLYIAKVYVLSSSFAFFSWSSSYWIPWNSHWAIRSSSPNLRWGILRRISMRVDSFSRINWRPPLVSSLIQIMIISSS